MGGEPNTYSDGDVDEIVAYKDKRIAELEAVLRLCVGALDRWQGTAPLSEAQVQARAVLKKTS